MNEDDLCEPVKMMYRHCLSSRESWGRLSLIIYTTGLRRIFEKYYEYPPSIIDMIRWDIYRAAGVNIKKTQRGALWGKLEIIVNGFQNIIRKLFPRRK